LVITVISVIALLFLFGGGMMGGWGYSPFGWIGMIFMWLIPVGFIALVVLGVIWPVRNVGNSTLPSSPNCGKDVQTN